MTIIPSGRKWAGRTECTAAESRVPRASGVHQHSEPPGQERLTYADGHETLVVTGKSWPLVTAGQRLALPLQRGTALVAPGPGPGTADDPYDGFRTSMPGVRTTPGCAPDFRTRTGPECTPWTTRASAPNPPPPVRRISRLHPQRTWCSACGARRQHRRPDRGRPLHGDAGAHGTSDRTPRRPPEARPALRRPGLHPGDAGGRAVAELLLGRTEPSGRLPVHYQPGPGAARLQVRRSDTGSAVRLRRGPQLHGGARLGPDGPESVVTSTGTLRATVTLTRAGRRPARETVQAMPATASRA